MKKSTSSQWKGMHQQLIINLLVFLQFDIKTILAWLLRDLQWCVSINILWQIADGRRNLIGSRTWFSSTLRPVSAQFSSESSVIKIILTNAFCICIIPPFRSIWLSTNVVVSWTRTLIYLIETLSLFRANSEFSLVSQRIERNITQQWLADD